LNRSGLGEGDIPDVVDFSANGSAASLTLAASVEIPPVLNVSVEPSLVFWEGGTCLQKTQEVVALATDDSGIASVVVRWIQAGEVRESTLPASGDSEYVGSAGPFALPGVVDLVVIATDMRGNQTSSSPIAIEVQTC
jgi:hypothetical protein